MFDLSQPGSPRSELFSDIEELWGAQPLASGKLIIGAGDALLLGDLSAPDRVELTIPEGELFISGWTRVPVRINDPAIAFDDLEFQIEPREAAAMVSYSRDNSFKPDSPHILLTAGWKPGKHKMIVIHRPTGDVVGQSTFEVLDTWEDEKVGPSMATFGSIESGPSGGTWGGPDSGNFNVPQNVNVKPALGTRNVGVVLVDTASALSDRARAQHYHQQPARRDGQWRDSQWTDPVCRSVLQPGVEQCLQPESGRNCWTNHAAKQLGFVLYVFRS